MANRRPKVPTDTKRALIDEVGGKCANPGCPNRLLQIHHIREWHVYQTHDERHMVAVCAACHDAIHRGNLRITDETLYAWKMIRRSDTHVHTNLWVEPGQCPQLWFGSLAFQSESKISVIELSQNNRVSFEIQGPDLLILDMCLTGKGGIPLIEVRNNTITHAVHPGLHFETAPGQVLLVAPADTPVVPRWLVNRMRRNQNRQYFPEDGYFVLFHATVIRPGVARISAILAEEDRAIVADIALHFLSRTHEAPVTFFAVREGESIIKIQGQIDWNGCAKIFGFADELAILGFEKFNPRTGPVPYDPDED